MEALVITSHASSHRSLSIAAGCAAADAWPDEDGFIQEDHSELPASVRHSEADSDDVLEALIQSELLKFQQQQAQKYAALLSEGLAFIPLASPAPGQQLLRAQQKEQEALAGECCLEQQERFEYVPSARMSLDAELLQQHSTCLQDCTSQQDAQQQGQGVASQLPTLCGDGASTSALCDAPSSTSSVFVQPTDTEAGVEQAQLLAMRATSSDADADPAACSPSVHASQCSTHPAAEHANDLPCGLDMAESSQDSAEPAAGLSTSCASGTAAAAAALGADPTDQEASCFDPPSVCTAAELSQLPQQEPKEPQGPGPAQQQCDVQKLLQQGTGPRQQQCKQASEPPEQGWAPDGQQLQQESPQPCEDEAQCPQSYLESTSQQLCSTQDEWQPVGTQQQWKSGAQACSAGDAAAVQVVAASAAGMDSSTAQQQQQSEAAVWPEALCAALAAVVAARPASDADLSDAEGFIYQDDEGSASPGAAMSPGAAPASGAASSQAGWSARTSADAAAAALAVSISTGCAGDLSPWDTFTEDRFSQQQHSAPHACAAAQEGSAHTAVDTATGGRGSPRARAQQLAHQQQQSPRQHRSQQWSGQMQEQCRVGSGAGLLSPQPQHPPQQQQQHLGAVPLPSSIQGHRLLQGLSYHRPNSAPEGGASRTGTAAAQHLQRQAQYNADLLPVVAESSQEGACSSRGTCRQSVASQMPSPGRHRPSCPGATTSCAATMHQQQQQQQDRDDEHRQQLLVRMQQLHLSRPASAEPWQRKQQLVHEPQRQWQQQSRRAGPAWNDSPMALNIPKWMPIAQAVQLPSPAVAASLAVGGWGSSILGGNKGTWPVEAVRSATTRPQTAGPVMLHSCSPWDAGLNVLPPRSGSVTARSASTSPSRRCGSRGPAGASGSNEVSSSTPAAPGFVLVSSAPSQPNSPPRPRGSGSSSAGACVRGAGCASVYLLDVWQQVRQANSICRQLGLSTQYLLAQGSSRKDKWQLEQIEIELWELADSSSNITCGSRQVHQQQQQQEWGSPGMGTCGSAEAGAAGAAGAAGQWQLKKRLSLPQFTGHLSKLKATSNAGTSRQQGRACCCYRR